MRVGNYLRFCSEKRNYGLIKGETLGRFLLILNMNISLTCLRTWLGQVWVSFGIYWRGNAGMGSKFSLLIILFSLESCRI